MPTRSAEDKQRKPFLSSKLCAFCGRPFAWRKRWARDWDEVRYCSEACRRSKPRGRAWPVAPSRARERSSASIPPRTPRSSSRAAEASKKRARGTSCAWGRSASAGWTQVEYALPAGAVGDLVGGRAVRALLDRMFACRHRVTADDLAAHAACREGEPMKVAITGASGLVGGAPEAGEIDSAALEGTDAVVHLAVENIAGRRCNEARKALLRSSRVGPTALLARTLAGLKKKPVRLESGLFVCGDHRDTASLHSAMLSGRRAAEAVLGRIPRDLP